MLHQQTADGPILHGWIDGDRTDAANGRAFVDKITCPLIRPFKLGDHGIKTGVQQQP